MLSQLLTALPPRPTAPDPLALRAVGPGLICEAAVGMIAAALERPSHVDPLLRARFREDRRLGSHDRGLIKDGVYGVMRRFGLAERLLVQGGWSGPPSPLALWLAWLVWERGVPAALAEARLGAPVLGPFERVPDTLRAWADAERPAPEALLACVSSLPVWMVQAWIAERGLDEALAMALAMGGRAPLDLRVNRLKATREQAQAALLQEGIPSTPGRWSPDALRVDGAANVVGTRAFATGLIEVQDEGSQLVAALVQPPRRGLVVDLCAGAGGKSLALAPDLPTGARVRGFDVRADALRNALRRAERAGAAERLRFEPLPPSGQAPLPPGSAARVLVDAPCTGTGTLRRSPGLRWRLQEGDVAEKAALQRALLEGALPLLRPGGRLIYATCSVQRAENEGVVEALLADHPELELIPAVSLLGAERRALCAGPYLATLPHQHGTDGFFGAVLQLRGPPAGGPPAPR